MATDQQRLSNEERANLVAFLDGELNAAEARAIELKRTQSVSARKELQTLQATWDLLDHLPRPAASPDFTGRTISLAVQAPAVEEKLASAASTVVRRFLAMAIGTSLLLAALGAGYAATSLLWPDRTRRLARDLPLVENLDAYLAAGNIGFVRRLDENGLFRTSAAPIQANESASSTNAEPTGLARLKSMPPARRAELASDLDRLERLSPTRQSEVRALRSAIASLPEAERERYLILLDRYGRWFSRLPVARRDELLALTPEARFDAVSQSLATSTAPPDWTAEIDRVWSVSNLFNPDGLLETAFLIRTWITLDPPSRNQVNLASGAADRRDELLRLANERGFRRADLVRGPVDEERRRIESVISTRIEAKAAQSLPKGIDPSKLANRSPALRKAQAAGRSLAARVLESRLIERRNQLFAPVDLANLQRFNQAIPAWIKEAELDPLPPEAALNRLHVLYRLVYPESEIDPKTAPTDETAPAPPATKPGTPKSGPTNVRIF